LARRHLRQGRQTDARGRRMTAIARRRYTEDRVSAGRVGLRMLAGFIVLAVFIAPYTIMFFGSVKTKAQIRSVSPTFLPQEWHWENYLTMWSTRSEEHTSELQP